MTMFHRHFGGKKERTTTANALLADATTPDKQGAGTIPVSAGDDVDARAETEIAFDPAQTPMKSLDRE